jgi:hypothetical protein
MIMDVGTHMCVILRTYNISNYQQAPHLGHTEHVLRMVVQAEVCHAAKGGPSS